jgi:hypothetical protein
MTKVVQLLSCAPCNLVVVGLTAWQITNSLLCPVPHLYLRGRCLSTDFLHAMNVFCSARLLCGLITSLALWLLAPIGVAAQQAAASAPSKPVLMASAALAGTSQPASAPVHAASARKPASGPQTGQTPPVDAAVKSPPDPCALLLHRMPGVSASLCEAARMQPSGAYSHKGLPLYVRDVRPHPLLGRPIRPLRILVVGAIHGDELTSASLALHWLALAEKDQRLVHWRFIPVLNPDGLLAKPPTRTNANGVDLNRNFPTPRWEQDAPEYWEKRTRKDPRRWPGPDPLSEPESVFLHQQMESFRPHLVVSLHAPYGLLDFDGPHQPPVRLGKLRLDRLGVFPGSLGHYGSVNQDMPVVTVELQHALDSPDSAEVRAMWRDLLRWIDTRLPTPRPAPHVEWLAVLREWRSEAQQAWDKVQWQQVIAQITAAKHSKLHDGRTATQ